MHTLQPNAQTYLPPEQTETRSQMQIFIRLVAHVFRKPVIRILLRRNAKSSWLRIRPLLAQCDTVFLGLVGENLRLPLEVELVTTFIEKYHDAKFELRRGLTDPNPYVVAYCILGIKTLRDRLKIIAPHYDSVATRTEEIKTVSGSWGSNETLCSFLRTYFPKRPTF